MFKTGSGEKTGQSDRKEGRKEEKTRRRKESREKGGGGQREVDRHRERERDAPLQATGWR